MDLTPGQRDAREFDAQLRALGTSERARRLDRLEQIWRCKQYEGRKEFWDQSVPVQERAPAIKHPVARIAGTRLASLVFGESRFPRVTAQAGSVGVGDLALSDEDAKVVSTALSDIIEKAEVKSRSRGMLVDGLKLGTAVPVVGIRAGIPTVEMLPAKWCTPTFSENDPDDVTNLVMQYRVKGDPEKVDSLGKPQRADREYWYRREITSAADIVWDGIECRRDNREPDWATERPTAPVRTLEFCPVVWGRNLPDSTCHEQLDGIPIVEDLDDEIEGLDLAHSMRHRNALYNGDPVPVVSGAGPEDVDAERGRQPIGPTAPRDGYAQYGGERAMKKGPGRILWLRKEGASASLMESSGAGNKILGDDAIAIRSMIFEAMSVVASDPDSFGTSELSARALGILFQPMLDLADNLRECWGKVLRRVLSKLLRLCAGFQAEAGGVFVRGIAEARPILRRFLVPLRDGTKRWIDPPLTMKWGPYFAPSQAELQATATTLSTATNGQPFLSKRSAVKTFAAIANLDDDVDAEVEAVDGEQGAANASLTEMIGATTPGEAPAAVQDAAMNGAQVSSLQGILLATAAKQLPVETAREMIIAAFPLINAEAVARMLAPIAAEQSAPVVSAVQP